MEDNMGRRRKRPEGNCHLCGTFTKLSFEHVPPRKAYNDKPILEARFDSLLMNGFESPKGKTSQRGSGGFTLCEKCNNDTGSWYAKDFIHWTWQSMRILALTNGAPSLFYQYHIFPLRVIKQIICMFFSSNGSGFQEKHHELVRFVLNREATGIDPSIKIYMYFNFGNRGRRTGIVGGINTEQGVARVFSELTYPPCGYIMTFNSQAPDDRLIEITHFTEYRYNDWKHISLRIPALEVYTPFPADFIAELS